MHHLRLGPGNAGYVSVGNARIVFANAGAVEGVMSGTILFPSSSVSLERLAISHGPQGGPSIDGARMTGILIHMLWVVCVSLSTQLRAATHGLGQNNTNGVEHWV